MSQDGVLDREAWQRLSSSDQAIWAKLFAYCQAKYDGSQPPKDTLYFSLMSYLMVTSSGMPLQVHVSSALYDADPNAVKKLLVDCDSVTLSSEWNLKNLSVLDQINVKLLVADCKQQYGGKPPLDSSEYMVLCYFMMKSTQLYETIYIPITSKAKHVVDVADLQHHTPPKQFSFAESDFSCLGQDAPKASDSAYADKVSSANVMSNVSLEELLEGSKHSRSYRPALITSNQLARWTHEADLIKHMWFWKILGEFEQRHTLYHSFMHTDKGERGEQSSSTRFFKIVDEPTSSQASTTVAEPRAKADAWLQCKHIDQYTNDGQSHATWEFIVLNYTPEELLIIKQWACQARRMLVTEVANVNGIHLHGRVTWKSTKRLGYLEGLAARAKWINVAFTKGLFAIGMNSDVLVNVNNAKQGQRKAITTQEHKTSTRKTQQSNNKARTLKT